MPVMALPSVQGDADPTTGRGRDGSRRLFQRAAPYSAHTADIDRAIRDNIRGHVEQLLRELGVPIRR